MSLVYYKLMFNNSSQNGSAHTVIIIVLVIALVGSLGFIFWQNFINTTDSNQEESITRVGTKSNGKNVDNEPIDKNNYTHIEEWGIVIPRHPEDNVIEYEIEPESEDVAHFVSSEQKTLGGQCGTFGFSYHALVRVSGDGSMDERQAMSMKHAEESGNMFSVDGIRYYMVNSYSGGYCGAERLGAGDSVPQAWVDANNNLDQSILSAKSLDDLN